MANFDKILTADVMQSKELLTRVLEIARESVMHKEGLRDREVAAVLKRALDKQIGPIWHVIVGQSFGSYVTHEKGGFAYFYIAGWAFLVFKTF